MKLLSGIAATIIVPATTYLIGVNAFHPWQGLRLVASSELEFGAALILAAVAAVVCGWRLIKGVDSGSELRRFIDAIGDSNDLG